MPKRIPSSWPAGGASGAVAVAVLALALNLAPLVGTGIANGQTADPPGAGSGTTPAPEPVPVLPVAEDGAIAARLQRILRSTGWYEAPQVDVRDGVVFLDGRAETQDQVRWAGDLAEKTEGAVAVVNRIDLVTDVGTTFGRAGEEVNRFTRRILSAWPIVLTSAVIVLVAWLLSNLVGRIARRIFAPRIPSPLLLAVVVRLFSIPVLLLGVYFVLQVAGLTRLAVTLLGGTGLIGIVIGFAFRDIAENFLASLLLSVRNPFRRGDLIEVAGHTGVVQNLNTRSTVLLTLDGNHVQIPNAAVFKSTIKNYSSSPSRRAEFMIGIGYDSSVAEAQVLISRVLADHPAVLAVPDPLVLVDALGDATVNLKVLYWFDSTIYAPDKINSALLRLSKNMLLAQGVELPDPAREIIFPRGVPVLTDGATFAGEAATPARTGTPDTADRSVATDGEGGLSNALPTVEPGVVPTPEATENLLKS